jgi:carnitine O-acetyltransferase
MAARTFTQPSSLEDTLVKASKMSGSEENGTTRSHESAKNSTQSYPSEAQAPLASHTNPNSRPGITFAHENNLPKLPIPELDSSCKKYIAALRPLQSGKEHSDTVHSVNDFLKTDGPVLQEKLKKYASGKANYIEQFCKYLRCTLAHYQKSGERYLRSFYDRRSRVSSISAGHTLTYLRVRFLFEFR